jgi:hypothetical protein
MASCCDCHKMLMISSLLALLLFNVPRQYPRVGWRSLARAATPCPRVELNQQQPSTPPRASASSLSAWVQLGMPTVTQALARCCSTVPGSAHVLDGPMLATTPQEARTLYRTTEECLNFIVDPLLSSLVAPPLNHDLDVDSSLRASLARNGEALSVDSLAELERALVCLSSLSKWSARPQVREHCPNLAALVDMNFDEQFTPESDRNLEAQSGASVDEAAQQSLLPEAQQPSSSCAFLGHLFSVLEDCCERVPSSSSDSGSSQRNLDETPSTGLRFRLASAKFPHLRTLRQQEAQQHAKVQVRSVQHS